MPRVVEFHDKFHQFEWSYIRLTYNKGRVSEGYVLYDDGSQATKEFEKGILKSETRTDNPIDPSANLWSEVRTIYDAFGLPAQVETDFDDGSSSVQTYKFGQLVSEVLTDNPTDPSTNSWASMRTIFEHNGDPKRIETVYDDGTVSVKSFAHGNVVHELVSDPTDAHDWSTVHTFFKPDGTPARVVTLFDDGTKSEKTYQNGLLASEVLTDAPGNGGVNSWSAIRSVFDTAGNPLSVQTVFDDGSISTKSFNDGMLTDEVVTDHQDQHPWQKIHTIFDNNGSPITIQTHFDDGQIHTETYSDGVLTGQTKQDAGNDGGLFNWSLMHEEFSNGVLEFNTTVFDSGDMMHVEFSSDGAPLTVWELDGDSDMPWLGKRVDYTPDGAEASAQYWYEGEILPAEFSEFADMG